MDESFEQLEANRRWLVKMRKRLGWSTTETAEFARNAAQLVRENLKLSQQAVSAFEKGRLKATPRWMGYVQMAMRQHLADRHLDEMGLADLRLPPDMALFFAARRADGDMPATEEGEDVSPNAGEHRQNFGSFPAQSAPDADTVELAELDVAYGFGATYLHDAPVKSKMRTFSRSWVRQFTDSPFDQLFWATGNGPSMMPQILENDLLLIDKAQQTPRMWDQFWAVEMHGLGMVKALRPGRDGSMRLVSINTDFPEEVAFDGEMTVIGRVVAIVRKV